MSANLYWRPVGTVKHEIPTQAPQAFLAILGRLFNYSDDSFRLRLGEEHLPTLETAARTLGKSQEAECLRGLAEAIEHHGEIEIWPEY